MQFFVSLHLKLLNSLHFPYAYVTTKLIDCIILSSSALNVLLLTSSVETLRLSFLNVSCAFNIYLFIYLFYFLNSLWFSLRLSGLTLNFPGWFILFKN